MNTGAFNELPFSSVPGGDWIARVFKRYAESDPEEQERFHKSIGDVCFTMGSQQTTVAGGTKWLELGAEAKCHNSQKALTSLRVVDRIGELETWEYHLLLEHRANPKKACLLLSTHYKQTSVSRGKQWLQLAADNGNKAAQDALEALAVVEAVGDIEVWQLRMIVAYADDLGALFCRMSVHVKQTNLTRAKKYLQLAADHEEETAMRSLDTLSAVSDMGEITTGEFRVLVDDVKKSDDVGDVCYTVAECQRSIDRARQWLRLGSEKTAEWGEQAKFCNAALMYATETLVYKKDEAMFMGRQSELMDDNLADPSGHRSVRFLVRTFLCGDLEKNRDSPIFRCFFRSVLSEAHLLPVVAKYLVPVEEKKEDPITCAKSEELCRLWDICRLLFLDLTPLEELDLNLDTINREFVSFALPLLSNQCRPLKRILIDGDDRCLFDLSFMSKIDTSKVECIRLNLVLFSSLTPLAQCDLSSLKEFHVSISKSMSTLDPICDWADFAPTSLDLSYTPIEDISPLTKIDLSRLKFPIYLSGTFVSDLTPLEEIKADGVEVEVYDSPAARKMKKKGLNSPLMIGNVSVKWYDDEEEEEEEEDYEEDEDEEEDDYEEEEEDDDDEDSSSNDDEE